MIEVVATNELEKHLCRAVCSSMKLEKLTDAVSLIFFTTKSLRTTLFSIDMRQLGIFFFGKRRGSITAVLFKWHLLHFRIESEAAEGEILGLASRV